MLWGARPQFWISSGDGGQEEAVGVRLLPICRGRRGGGAAGGTWHRRRDPSRGHQGVGGAAEAQRARPAAVGPGGARGHRTGAPRPAGRGGESERGVGGEAPPHPRSLRPRARAGSRAAPERASGRAACGKGLRLLRPSSPTAFPGFRPRRRGRDPHPARAPCSPGTVCPPPSLFSALLSPDPA